MLDRAVLGETGADTDNIIQPANTGEQSWDVRGEHRVNFET